MKRRYPQHRTVIAKWQHLEYFQWFSQKFDAVRNNQITLKYDGSVTFKVSPMGLGIAFHKHRGVELCRRVANTKQGWQSMVPFSDTAPFASLSERLDYWRGVAQDLVTTDFRTATALALALNYQPNPVHSSRRKLS